MYPAILFLPLAAALIVGFFGRILGDKTSAFIASALLVAVMALSWLALYRIGIQGEEARVPLLPWIGVGDLQATWSLRIDTLTAVMLVVVTTVSALVHLYSIGYMQEANKRGPGFGIAALATLAANRTSGKLTGVAATPAHVAAALTDGYALAFSVAAVVLAATAAVAMFTLPSLQQISEPVRAQSVAKAPAWTFVSAYWSRKKMARKLTSPTKPPKVMA